MIVKSLQQACISMLDSIKKHDAEILTGVGIAGMVTGTFFAIKATVKATKVYEEVKKEKEDVPAKEIVKLTWKYYIPTVVIEGVSAFCLIQASVTSNKRNAALAAAYSIAETSLKEYQDKVIETIGEKKESKIHDEIAKDKLLKDPIENHQIIFTGNGDTLCYDTITGRYFKSDIEKIRKVENEFNKWLLGESYIPLNELYEMLGLDGVFPIGEELGWNINGGYMEFRFSSQLCTDGTPCLVVGYKTPPYYYFSSRY